ncbi:MAG: ATP--guanido phosphotransferase, partial [Planctomycetaceae bacterium]|nr:ATP--guanido phosphotransferase [Planctomycetaceae bacterium]
LHHLSSLRLGVNMKLLDNITINEVNRLFLESQAAHLQKITGQKLPSQVERDVARAKFLRTKLGTL